MTLENAYQLLDKLVEIQFTYIPQDVSITFNIPVETAILVWHDVNEKTNLIMSPPVIGDRIYYKGVKMCCQ